MTEQQGYEIIHILNQIKWNLDAQKQDNISSIQLFDKLSKVSEELKSLHSELFEIKLRVGKLADIKNYS